MPVMYRWATVLAEGPAWLDSVRNCEGELARSSNMLVSVTASPASSQEVTLAFPATQARVVLGWAVGRTEDVNIWLMPCLVMLVFIVSCAATMASEDLGGGKRAFVVGVDARQIHLSPTFPTSLIIVDGTTQYLESRNSTNDCFMKANEHHVSHVTAQDVLSFHLINSARVSERDKAHTLTHTRDNSWRSTGLRRCWLREQRCTLPHTRVTFLTPRWSRHLPKKTRPFNDQLI